MLFSFDMDYHIYPSRDTPYKEQAPSYRSLRSSVDCKDSALPSSESKETIPNFAYDSKRPGHLEAGPRNVIFFGASGVGKSSVINLIAGKEVARISSGLNGCTLSATSYSFTFPGMAELRIFDTVGLEEPELNVTGFLEAMVNARELVESLRSAGGVDLLVFCIRGGRITTTMQRSYRLFFEFLCEKKVPLAIVVTNLELEKVMENWWMQNEAVLKDYGIQSTAHACITAVPEYIKEYAAKRAESQETLRNMLRHALSDPDPYIQESRGWFVSIAKRLRSFVKKKAALSERELSKRLEEHCNLPPDDAMKLAKVLARRGSAK